MKKNDSFFKTVCSLAVPVTLQSMLQSSFSIVDQIMIGQLGTVSVAGVGLAGKFASIYSVVISAIGAVAGIMIAQYLGQKNKYEVRRSFYTNLILGAVIAGLFMFFCVLFPERIMGLYTKDAATREEAGKYLAIVAGTFMPLAGATLLSTLFRCIEKARLPLYATIASALLNTGLNYVLIFGKLGFSPMGARGAAIATLVSQCANLVLMLLMFPKKNSVLKKPEQEETENAALNWKQYLSMLLPILACEVLWSLGENVYAGIYGHMGTKATAAMTKKLGTGDYSDAYKASKKLIFYGAAGSIFLSVIVVLTAGFYVQIYQVEEVVKQLTVQILYAYALVAPFKVLNMILGGGIIRSGGRTKYVMFIDIIGTWCFGVPLGFLAAFVLKLPIPYVYFILSLEECIRFAISVGVFRRKKWMQQLEA